jgi:hypothetical protein
MQVAGESFANTAKCFQQFQEMKTALTKKLKAHQILGLLVPFSSQYCVF